ncbi:hypothetical protein [Deinococcus aestuarii]|uniref:hypothetical protein n=1 Tax=Deinococcus aestuarii TaxID=2774531 RepID=UPI001C0E01F4|nr:hypothetical protein [Deinococcus aestuarii]
MMQSKEPSLPARQSFLPVFRRLPRGGLLLWALTLHVGVAMLCLAFVIFAHGLPLSVWPSLVALLLNLASSAMLTIFSQEPHRDGEPAKEVRPLYRSAFLVGGLGLALAIYAAVPFFTLVA